jgi:hypothetical protein
MRSGCPVEASLTTLDLTQLNHISGTINTDHPSAHCGQLKTEDAEAAAHVQRQAVTSGVSIQQGVRYAHPLVKPWPVGSVTENWCSVNLDVLAGHGDEFAPMPQQVAHLNRPWRADRSPPALVKGSALKYPWFGGFAGATTSVVPVIDRVLKPEPKRARKKRWNRR